MGATADAFAAAAAKLTQIDREGVDRRAMRERRADLAQAKAQESFAKQGHTMQRYAEHVAELVRRQQQAGGWGTAATLEDGNKPRSFGFEEDLETQQGEFDDPAAAYSVGLDRPHSGSMSFGPAQSQDQPTPPSTRPPRVAPRSVPRRPAGDKNDEDEDFSSQSWLRGR